MRPRATTSTRQLAGSQFGANQAARRDAQQIGQNQFAANFGSQEAQRRYNNALVGAGFQLGQRQWNAGFGANQNQQQFANQLAAAGFGSGQNQLAFQNWLAQQQLGLQRQGLDQSQQQVDANRRGGIWSGIAGIAGSVLPFLSDEDAKIDHGVVGALPVHSFSYRGDPSGTPYTGVMAGEVAQAMPEAVMDAPDGFRRVSLARLLGGAQ